MSQNGPSKNFLLEEALKLIELMGWRAFSFTDLAEKTELPLSEIYKIFPEKSDVLNAFVEKIDLEVLSSISKEDRDEPRRERLFELFMNRFETLTPHKKALRSVWDGAFSDPLSILKAAPKGLHSLQWMLEAAGYDMQGPTGPIKVNGFALMYIGVVSDWLDDDTDDQSKTMASLDKLLTRLDGCLS